LVLCVIKITVPITAGDPGELFLILDDERVDMTRVRGFNRNLVAGFVGGLLLLVVLSAGSGAAQTQSPPSRLAFDAVSIKPADVPRWLPAGLSQITFRGRRFRGDPVTARRLIVEAFQIKEWQLVGGPDWVATDRFTMEATINGDAPLQKVSTELPGLLKGVLADRFQLHVHTEQRRFRGYALVRSRSDGGLGPRLRVSKADCDAQPSERAATASTGTAPPSPTGPPKCLSIAGPSWIAGTGLTMQGLVDYLTGGNGAVGKTDRPVVDRTELAGRFDFLLDWSPAVTPDADAARPAAVPVPPQAPDWLREAVHAAPTPDGTSIFTALREQLGLELEPRNERFDVLVIDRIERPSPN
jgi:uncharacterized protein (TIGR03435 family)